MMLHTLFMDPLNNNPVRDDIVMMMCSEYIGPYLSSITQWLVYIMQIAFDGWAHYTDVVDSWYQYVSH